MGTQLAKITHSRPGRLLLAAVAALILLLVGGMIGVLGLQGSLRGSGASDSGGGISGGSRDAVSSQGYEGDSDTPAQEPAVLSASDSGDKAQSVDSLQAQVISNGWVTIGGDVFKLRTEVVKIATMAGGRIANEASSSDIHGRYEQTSITFRVPSSKFDSTMTELAKVGRLIELNRTAEDVTTQALDVAARVRVQTAAVNRISALLGKAKSIRDIVALESELSQRQAELESLTAQQKWLSDQTAMSTIVVTLQGKTAPTTANAFVRGLRAGWKALGASFAALVTVLGAVIPWLILVVPVLFVVRRWLRREHPKSAPGPESAT